MKESGAAGCADTDNTHSIQTNLAAWRLPNHCWTNTRDMPMLSRYKYRLVCLVITAIIIIPAAASAVGSFDFPDTDLLVAVITFVLMFSMAWSCGWYIDSLKQQSIPPQWFFVHKHGLASFSLILLLVGFGAYVYLNWVRSISAGLVVIAAICIYLPITLILDRVSQVQKR